MKPSFKINGVKYVFEDITLRKYYELQRVLKLEEKDKNKEFEIVEILTSCPIKELKKISYQDWLIIWEEAVLQISSLNGNADTIKPTIQFQGETYSLPSVEAMSVGEFADLEVLFSQGNSAERLHEMAGILYRPVVKKFGQVVKVRDYDSEEAQERAELFLDLPVSAIRSANAFFLQSANLYLKNIAGSLTQNLSQTSIPLDVQDQLRRSLLQDHGGSSSIPLLETILSSLMQLQSSKFVPPSTGLPTGKVKLIDRIWRFKNKLSTK